MKIKRALRKPTIDVKFKLVESWFLRFDQFETKKKMVKENGFPFIGKVLCMVVKMFRFSSSTVLKLF